MSMPPVYSGSINDWAEALKRHGLDELASRLFEDEQIKLWAHQVLIEAGLPTLRSFTVNLAEFMAKPDAYYRKLEAKNYHVTLLSELEGKRRLRGFPYTKETVMEYINQNIKDPEHQQVTLILKEFYENRYGGNLIINPDGGLIVEVVEGEHIHSVLGTKNVVAYGQRKGGSKRVDFYTDHAKEQRLANLELEQVLRRGINLVPKSMTGYFEMIVVEGESKKLTPIFIDYRNKDIYFI